MIFVEDDSDGCIGNCDYLDLTTINNLKFSNSILHLNICSLAPKVNELEIF